MTLDDATPDLRMLAPFAEQLRAFLSASGDARVAVDFGVRLGAMELMAPATDAPAFTLVLRRPELLASLSQQSDLQSLGEAYLRGDVDVEGDIEAIYPLVEVLRQRYGDRPSSSPEDLAFEPREETPHSVERDADAIAYHYDQSNPALSLVMGPSLVYSAAYFHDPEDSLEQAQANKLDRACQKVGVRPGERVLEIGCGWGSLMAHLADEHQARVHGVTISREQYDFVRGRMAAEGLQERCEVSLQDYRAIDDGPYDRIISLGMVEHVGVANLGTYFAKAFELLKPGGLFLCQGCTSNVRNPTERVNEFAHRYLFPDAEFPYLTRYLQAAEEAGFEVHDVEALRKHYALTHRRWRENLEANADAIRADIGDRRYRALRLLYSWATYYFLDHRSGVYQMLLFKPDGPDACLPDRRPL